MTHSSSTSLKPQSRPRILLLSAYDAGSHRRWREQLADALPEYEWHTLSLPARYFRWRIRGNPLSWLDEPLLDEPWDALLVTTMVDLATLRGLKSSLAHVPVLAYCHENQFAYPNRPTANDSLEPKMVNLYTLLSADKVAFNSKWNRDSLIAGVEAMVAQFPDKRPQDLGRVLSDKSVLLPVPIPDEFFQEHKARSDLGPHLLWNHRWEHDKGPDRLLLLLRALRRRGFDFRLSVVGEQFRQVPEAFQLIAREFADCVKQWGFQSSEHDYRSLLAEADVVLSTALHDFQGLAVLEAMAAGTLPWVPDRLAYPEYVPKPFLYPSNETDAVVEAEASASGLIALWARVRSREVEAIFPDAYRSSRLMPVYRSTLAKLIGGEGGAS